MLTSLSPSFMQCSTTSTEGKHVTMWQVRIAERIDSILNPIGQVFEACSVVEPLFLVGPILFDNKMGDLRSRLYAYEPVSIVHAVLYHLDRGETRHHVASQDRRTDRLYS